MKKVVVFILALWDLINFTAEALCIVDFFVSPVSADGIYETETELIFTPAISAECSDEKIAWNMMDKT